MTQGEEMAEVTSADRLWAELNIGGLDYQSGQAVDYELAVARVAAARATALAEEREKARAPFLALAQELATVATDHHATVAGDAYADAADRIVAVLEGTYR